MSRKEKGVRHPAWESGKRMHRTLAFWIGIRGFKSALGAARKEEGGAKTNLGKKGKFSFLITEGSSTSQLSIGINRIPQNEEALF